ncbi:uncharacterized protein LOC62_04G006232 [Vanrija pseudolonga]|nr:hypothetical protein LOC62_04G006232 [Vanrija pseudolonga]WOO82751.1 hypothetical protein LOC62_04G006232 [Vanrija pseudolonga]
MGLTGRAAQVTLFATTIFFSIIVLGLDGYLTGEIYSYINSIGSYGGSSSSGSGGSGSTYLTSSYRTAYTTYSTSDYSISTYTFYSISMLRVWSTFLTSSRTYGYTTYYTTRYKRDGEEADAPGPVQTDAPTPAITAAPSGPTAPPTGPPAVQLIAQDRAVEPVEERLHHDFLVPDLVKRKKGGGSSSGDSGSSGSSSGGSSSSSSGSGSSSHDSGSSGSSYNYGAWKSKARGKAAPYIVVLVWAILVALYAIFHLIVSALKPTMPLVSVMADLGFLVFLLIFGLGAVAALSALGPFLSPVAQANVAMSWILWLILLGMALFEFFYVRRFWPGKENLKKSLRTLEEETRAGAQKPVMSQVYPDPNVAAGAPLLAGAGAGAVGAATGVGAAAAAAPHPGIGPPTGATSPALTTHPGHTSMVMYTIPLGAPLPPGAIPAPTPPDAGVQYVYAFPPGTQMPSPGGGLHPPVAQSIRSSIAGETWTDSTPRTVDPLLSAPAEGVSAPPAPDYFPPAIPEAVSPPGSPLPAAVTAPISPPQEPTSPEHNPYTASPVVNPQSPYVVPAGNDPIRLPNVVEQDAGPMSPPETAPVPYRALPAVPGAAGVSASVNPNGYPNEKA